MTASLYRQTAANCSIRDPGSGGTLPNDITGTVEIVTAGAEARTLPRPLRTGHRLVLNAKTLVGACTITVTGGYNETGTTSLVLSSAGQVAIFESVWDSSTTFGWRMIGYDIVGDLASTASGKGASLIGLEDANGYTAATTVESAIDYLNFNWITYGGIVQLPLNNWRETSTMNVGNAAAIGGVLASDTTPILSAVNGATAGCQQLAWAATNVDEIAQSVILPNDLDDTKDIVFKCLIKSAGTTDAVGFSVASYFGPTGTAITDTTTTNQTATYAIKAASIATADFVSLIAAGTAQVLTIGLTPVAHGTDIMYCAGTWLEYTRRVATA